MAMKTPIKSCRKYEGLPATCRENACKMPGFCKGSCGCMSCDARWLDQQPVTWKQ